METVEKRIFAIVVILQEEELDMYKIVCVEVNVRLLEDIQSSFWQVL